MYIMKEQKIATRFLFLGMARTIIQRDIRTIQAGPFKIKEIYIDQLEKMHSAATNERMKLKKIMWDKRISIIFVEKDDMYSTYKVIYNGNEVITPFHNNMIRKHVKDILEELMREGD